MSNQQEWNPPDRPCCEDLSRRLNPRFFKALCDPSRVSLLVHLAQCGAPCTVTQIAECCPVDISVVSRHLAILRDAGILEAKRQGKEVYYAVRYPDLAATLRSLAEAIEACAPVEATQPQEVDHGQA